MPHSPLKIVVSGPVGAGKTTFTQTMSSVPVVTTDEVASERIGKAKTTVAMDFGSLEVGGHEIMLFGTPGQERFDYMWSVLCEGATGLLLLVAAHRPGTFLKARHILEFITSQVPIPYLVGVTHNDAVRKWDMEEIAEYFQIPLADLIPVDARDKTEGARALFHLLERCLPADAPSAEEFSAALSIATHQPHSP